MCLNVLTNVFSRIYLKQQQKKEIQAAVTYRSVQVPFFQVILPVPKPLSREDVVWLEQGI